MIVLDTHIWVWWIDGDAQLSAAYRALLELEAPNGLAISAISCWEVAKLVELGRLEFEVLVEEWLATALRPPVVLLPLSPEVAVESTRLPGEFHRDSADQMIVATARIDDCSLVTLDQKILSYPHVRLAP